LGTAEEVLRSLIFAQTDKEIAWNVESNTVWVFSDAADPLRDYTTILEFSLTKKAGLAGQARQARCC